MIRLCLLLFQVLNAASENPARAPSLADIGPAPAVELVDQDGQPFALETRRGKVVLVGFVYTTCTGSCPATTAGMVGVQAALKEAGLWGEKVEFVSISLDPERDTPDVLARYAKNFGADTAAWHFLTGPPGRVDRVIAAWDMWAKRDANGVLDHPSRLFLVDSKGRQREIYNLPYLKPEAVLADVRAILGEAAAKGR